MLSSFAFVSIASWADARRRERQTFYRSEAIKKVTEASGEGAAAALEIVRQEERVERRKRHEGQKLGGLISSAVGIGLMIFLHGVERQEPVYLVGFIPVLVGVALLTYVVLTPARD